MLELNIGLSVLHIVALTKIILFVFLAAMIWAIWKEKKSGVYVLILTLAFVAFYVVLSWPLKRMFWGNSGDETFILAFLGRVLHGQYGADFYYSWLPPFYPPLYFWLIGTIARPLTANAIMAAKVGVVLTLLAWFSVPYLVQKKFWPKKEAGDSPIKSSWFWLLAPLIYILTLEFHALISKPYETFSALLAVILIGLISENLALDKWSYKKYLFFGLGAGLLFLAYYFWWFMLIPVLLFLVLTAKNKIRNFSRLVIIGLFILIISLPYTLPLVLSGIKYGAESWQAVFFVPQDLFTFAPWFSFSWQGLIAVLGLIGLICFRRQPFVRASLTTLVFCYVYQLINIFLFSLGFKSAQAAKPFLFLGGAALAVGAAYLILYLYWRFLSRQEDNFRKLVLIILLIIILPLFPWSNFIEDPKILNQLEQDLIQPPVKDIANWIKINIPDYSSRTWLSSGVPEINAYLPLSYYLAHNPHFSHESAIYSQRQKLVQRLTGAKTPEELMSIISQGAPRQIDSLLLYYDNPDSFSLFFWQDNYPNGGKEITLKLPRSLISEQYWLRVFDSGLWAIYIRK